MKKFLMTIVAIGAAGFLSACAQKSAYEAAVEEFEPVYCYQSLGGVSCYKKPNFRDERRMVNYYGPAPKRYDRPAPPPEQVLFAPEPVNYWVKDPEPIPRPAPKGDLADRPWVGGTKDEIASRAVISEVEMRLKRGLPATDGKATEAFIKRIEERAALTDQEIQ
ncbi:MAG: hypothetical protein HOB37_11300 [Rhodospirillaceae bacterium]|jgi:hypothetical protein|nr:hypothetical protein [Rhodospirillaceae bacterium]MBT3910473.1 hypothetical protein [Rhodospirillaceae bacterium]MBT5300490.1 hypothetical protein [Rhodospirillaceae bacterium]MBT5515730.1 hypothetical protein [Rhodospirillaceae bacterium]MBT6087158.1 hypothetical protein [Rhodospirillaceae bacterium]